MSSAAPSSPASAGGDIPFREFVVIIAALMAVNALGIDAMLPALPVMAHALGFATENQQQWIVAAYVIGMGGSQIVFGPIADRYGRRVPVLFCLALYAVTSLVASFANSFETMIAARVAEGVGAAGARVIAVAMVRDRFAGREMARVMSLVLIIFLAVPMLAPTVGSLVMTVAPWRAIFHLLAGFGVGLAVWIAIRVPETLDPEHRMPIQLRPLTNAIRLVLTNRASIGYTAASCLSFGAMLGFVSSAQQLFSGPLHGPEAFFPLFFASAAAGMAVATFTNSRIVMRLGSRRVSHWALLLFVALSAVRLVTTALIGDSLVDFVLFQCATMFCAGLMGSNFSAMAMEPMGSIAGTAAAVQGMLSTMGGGLVAAAIGQSFDGTTLPLLIGYCLCSLGALGCVLFAEGGRLMRPLHADTLNQ